MSSSKNSVFQSWWWKSYRKLPLWGQIAAPAAAIILLLSLFKMFGWVLKIGVMAAAVYIAILGYQRVKGMTPKRGPARH